MKTRLRLDRFLAVGVGSLPHKDPQEACSLIQECLKGHIPYWPQLPKRDFKENMYVQYSQGLPGVVIDPAGQRIYIDTAKGSYQAELEAAYEHYLADDLEYFAITEDYAAGLYEFTANRPPQTACRYIKGHTIGPISFGLTVSDQNKQASIYNREFCECLVKVLAAKSRWQARRLKTVSGLRPPPNGGVPPEAASPVSSPQVIIFIDEPYLVSIGSSFFNIKAEEVVRMLNEVIAAIHQEEALAGIHCCGNTDWSIVLKSDIDILNYDAYNYLDSIFLYRGEIEGFQERGGVIAWGIAPNGPDGVLPSAQGLRERLDKYKAYLKRPGLVSPSCGLSGVSKARAGEILSLAAATASGLSLG